MLKHWYLFVFHFVVDGEGFGHQNQYAGYDDACVSLPRIKQAQLSSGAPDDSVLLSISYLGLMSEETFKGTAAAEVNAPEQPN